MRILFAILVRGVTAVDFTTAPLYAGLHPDEIHDKTLQGAERWIWARMLPVPGGVR